MDERDHYLEELLNFETLPGFAMTDYGRQLPPDNGFFYAGNRQLSSNGFSAAGNRCLPENGFYSHLLDNDFFDDDYVQSGNNFNYDAVFDNPLESEFNRLSISTPLYSPAPALFAGGSGGVVEISNLQRLRAQSAARAQNMGLKFYYENNLNQSPFIDGNLNGISRYAYNYHAGRSNSNGVSSCYRPRVGSSSSSFVSSRRSIFSSLNDLRGKIALAAKDQIGCRFLQNRFEEGNPEDIHLIFSEVKDQICELMTDQFGNYLVQKFFRVCNEKQMTQLLCLVIKDERKLKDICTDMHGTRAVQKLLEHLTTPEQRSLVISALRRITLSLIKNNNGQHVIQHCLKYFPNEDNKHILNVVADNCLDVATDKSGCCVLQLCLTHSAGESRDRLIAQITSNALILSEHPYGNYVVQFILGFKIVQVTSDIMAQLSGHYVSLSMNKYGSNVVEECLKQSEGDEALPIIEELIRSPNFLRVLQDPYGNYVAQSALMVSKGEAQHAMVKLVLVNYPFLHSHPHGKRVLARTKGIKLRP